MPYPATGAEWRLENGDVVRDAVEYLARHEGDDAEWQALLTAVVARIRAGVPRGEALVTIEREITAAARCSSSSSS